MTPRRRASRFLLRGLWEAADSVVFALGTLAMAPVHLAGHARNAAQVMRDAVGQELFTPIAFPRRPCGRPDCPRCAAGRPN